jgi:bacteriocin resistance YdeI/OmpD-like protein
MAEPIRLRGELKRKALQLACYIEIPQTLVAPWGIAATTVVDATANGQAIGRRTLKPWGDGKRWFIELTGVQCRQLAVSLGDRVDLSLTRADETPPPELLDIIETSSVAKSRWQKLSTAQQRMLSEHVRGAAREPTRVKRARQALIGS